MTAPSVVRAFDALPGGRLGMMTDRSSIVVDPADGGRLVSLRIDDTEILGASTPAPGAPPQIFSGSFLMAPFVGRTANGRFDFNGRRVSIPLNFGPHAMHGFVFDRPWSLDPRAADTIAIDLDERWPFGGTVTQGFELGPDRLTIAARITNESVEMPAILGFHPWFTERLANGAAGSFDFAPGTRYVCDDTGIPVGTIEGGGERPWDDSFTDVAAAPTVHWTDGPTITILSAATHWIVCETMPRAFCVEPLSGPVNGLATGEATTVGPGRPLELAMTLRWR